MKACVWILAALFQTALSQFELLNPLVHLGLWAHDLFLNALELTPSSYNWFYGALLAGADENLRHRPELRSFMTLGLYHLIVVSGSHVVGIQKLTESITKPFPPLLRRSLLWSFLLAFAFINRLQPACTRAVLAWALSQSTKSSPSKGADIQLTASCLCLLIAPQWASSLSFQLSCAASLGLSITGAFSLRWPRLAAALCCTVLMAPLLTQVQPCYSWLVLPANTFALPVLELGLLPVSLLSVIVPGLRGLTEPLIEGVFSICDGISAFENPRFCLNERKMKSWGMIYLILSGFLWRWLLPFWHRSQLTMTAPHRRS